MFLRFLMLFDVLDAENVRKGPISEIEIPLTGMR